MAIYAISMAVSRVSSWLRKSSSKLRDRETLTAAAPLIGLIVLSVFFTALNPRFASQTNLMNILRQSAILWVVVVGQTFVVLSGALDLSVEGNMALSGIIAALLVTNDRNGNDLGILAVLLAVGAGALMGLFNGVVHVKGRVPSFMVTLGTWFMGMGMAVILFQGKNFLLRDRDFLNIYLGRLFNIPAPVLLALVIVLVGVFIQNYTRFGRHVYAIGGGEDLAKMSGIRVAKNKILLFTVAGLFFGIAGVMSAARLGQGTALIGSYLFPTISAVVVGGTSITGGTGGILRSVLGVLFVVSVGSGMILIGLHPFAQIAVQGLVFVIAVYFTLDRSKVPLLK